LSTTLDFLDRQKKTGHTACARAGNSGFREEIQGHGRKHCDISGVSSRVDTQSKTTTASDVKAWHRNVHGVPVKIFCVAGKNRTSIGCHWLQLFSQKPVYWGKRSTKNRSASKFRYGTFIRRANPRDVALLMERRERMMWTAHPRIKG